MDKMLKKLFSSDEEELYVLDCLSYVMMSMACVTFVVLLFENVPYGRYASSKYGFHVSVRLSWLIQELPAFLVPLSLVLWASSSRAMYLPNQLLLGMYFCHYFQRTFIYPFLIRGGKPTPFGSFALAFAFCTCNGYLQARYLSHYAEFPPGWVTHPYFITGSCLWFLGWVINIHSDHILRNLRAPGETGYNIPRGGLFEYVSGANFLGEIIEWAGFALAVHSIHSAAFALFTSIILSSRAVAHHKWYLVKFEDYPKHRKALIPFVF
ncbi:3-oxo-5-alpha-steroid 4-dehydrogenase 1 [Electrophorus electricus]|uniref:3-oxo-5-alpha-steroid 4-dehydrogenase n=1 Tax=Electrophorus electricus TaxID=8005 RepID=A0A4W4GRD6_ELEEL|nr:3-oxo-5-alpha-steroid 4-dehydrogenase 1 [Electrophorus electricus]